MLPRYQAKGNDGFFLSIDVRPSWLTLSAWLRRKRLDRFLHLLPGVVRVEGDARKLRINRHRASYGVRQIFRLFGFRRFREDAKGYLFLRRPDKLDS